MDQHAVLSIINELENQIQLLIQKNSVLNAILVFLFLLLVMQIFDLSPLFLDSNLLEELFQFIILFISFLVPGKGFTFKPPLVRLSIQKELKSRFNANRTAVSLEKLEFPSKFGYPKRTAVFIVY